VQNDVPRYAAVIKTALTQGITTIEAGPDGGDVALAQVLQPLLVGDSSQAPVSTAVAAEGVARRNKPIQCLLRVGYRTVRPPRAEDAVVDAELRDALFPHDVLVEEEPTASSKTLTVDAMEANSSSSSSTKEKNAGRARVLHNIGPEYLAYVLSESPLIQLAQEHPDKLQVAVLLHNPEVQKSSDRTNLVDQLQQSFVALQQYVNQGKIATFGVVSNGFSLPEQHPLYLSWKDHVLAAVLKANNPAGSAGAAAGVKLGIVQLPVNLLETQGMVVAQEMHRHRIQKYADLLHSMQIYALRPMTCYPDRGTGTGHPFILADYKLPAKFATESLSSSEAGAATAKLQRENLKQTLKRL